MVRYLSYLNSMSDIVYKKYKILVHAITFNIIVFNQQKLKNAGSFRPGSNAVLHMSRMECK